MDTLQKIPLKMMILVLLALFLFSCGKENENPRITKTINSNWTFNYFPDTKLDENYIVSDFDDKLWPAIALPHTWSTYETTGDVHPFIKYPSERDDTYWWYGWGIYRKKFKLDKSLENKNIIVEFDGIQKYCRVYLNGNFIEEHKGGFTSFYADLTANIDWENENILAVAVNGRRNDEYRIPPMTAGNWNVYSGIYRDVRIVAKSKVHFPFQGSYKHEGGVFITTPEVSSEKAIVNVKSFVKNELEQDVNAKVIHEIFSPSNILVSKFEDTEKIGAGKIWETEITSKDIKNPQLWSPDDAILYKVVSSVFVNGKLSDQISNPLGFRFFRWDYEKDDLYVNGEKINIKGTNRHQEYPWLGDAHPKWIAKMDLEDIKYNLGHNFMRLTHYPNDEYLYKLADSMGIIMVEEVPNIKSIDFDEEIQKQNVVEMIRRDRNHPSIFFWSVGNETKDAADSKWVIEEDTTRIVHARKCDEGAGDFVEHDHRNLDMENLLRVTIRGWFDEDDAPEGFSSTPENGQHSSNETWQHDRAIIRGGSVRGLLGDNCNTWLYEDHGADREYLNCILKHINPKGWVDMYRQPKYIYWLTKCLYTDIPTLFIHPHFWREKYLGQNKNITIDSNCDEVELFVNGRSLGKKNPTRENFFTLDYENVLVEKGELKLIGVKGDKKVEYSVIMPGQPKKLTLETEQTEILADRSGIAIVKANILDETGNPVFDANNTLNWEIEGPAALVGESVYHSDIQKYEEWNGTGYTVVPVCNVIRSTNIAGKITLTVNSPGLEPASIEIESILPAKTNLPIIEFELKNEGRKRIEKDQAFSINVNLLTGIMNIRENHKIEGENINQIADHLSEFIRHRNYGLDQNSAGFRAFVEVLSNKIQKLNGELIADDYNFLAGQFNTWFTLEQMVTRSEISGEKLSVILKDYAEKIIVNANPVDLAVEKEKLLSANH